MPINIFKTFYKKGITLNGVLFSDRCVERTVRMLPRMDFSNIIQRVHPLEDYEKAFDDMRSGHILK